MTRHSGTTFRALLFLLALTGCLSAMALPSESPSNSSDQAKQAAANHFPLKFKRHEFAAFCYNTIGCEVIYANNNFTRQFSHDAASPPPASPHYRDNWGLTGWGPVFNFPPPALVRWKSLDGTSHETTVDIGTIFRDEVIRYSVADNDIADGIFSNPGPAGEPTIFLEVNDRTINVFMRALIPTKEEQVSGNRFSKFRDDLILAWTRTY
jgi:hypothetical protein